MDHNNKTKIKHLRNSTRMGLDSETLLIVKLPDPKILRAVSRSLFLALIFITFPCIGSFLRGLKNASDKAHVNASVGFDFEQFDELLRGLAEEGLLRKSDKALILSPGVKSSASRYLKNFHADQTVMALDSASDEGPSSLFFDETFDFVYSSNLAREGEFEFVNRVVKPGGVVAFTLSEDYVATVRGMVNYRIAYIRRYSTTIVVMRKMEKEESAAKRSVERASSSTMRRRLLQATPYPSEATKAEALKALEEVLLEPPRWQRKKHYSRKIKFLPELLGGDSLEGFRRRVFVNVGFPENSRDMTQWFEQNYPKMRQEFEVYDINVVPEEGNDVSEWLRENVREEEYVVMKAEAEVVEEMVRNKAIHLVDELFLECHNAWWIVSKRNKKSKSDESKRAYWECLALYGRVKDEGVAVHQWWGW